MKQYPYREWMWSRDWTPAVWDWLKNLEIDSWRRYKDPADFGDSIPEVEFHFEREEDALAFKLKFR